MWSASQCCNLEYKLRGSQIRGFFIRLSNDSRITNNGSELLLVKVCAATANAKDLDIPFSAGTLRTQESLIPAPLTIPNLPKSGDSTRAYRPDIDGLRALAILLVIAYHYFGLPGGYIGVDVFFVISGYLITGMLLADLEESRLSLLDFYARRFRRILPPVLVVIVASFFVGWAWLLPYDFRALSEEACASALYVFNFLLWHQSGYFDASASTKPLLHLWSLAVEEQFYLVWPAFLLLANRWKRRTDLGIVAILLGSFLINLVTIQDDQAAAFYSPLSRLWELASGGLLVQYERLRNGARVQAGEDVAKSSWSTSHLPIVGLLLILGAAALYNRDSNFPGYLAAIPVLGAVLIVAGGAGAWLNRALLACRPMVYVGKLSYSLYLWHWPVLVLATLLYADEHFRYLNVTCLALSGLLACGTYYCCERPIRQIPVNAGNAWKFLLAGIGSSATIAVFTFVMSAGMLARATDSMLITKEYKRPDNGCYFKGWMAHEPNPAIFAPCEVIRFPGRPVVVLVGDSHAYSLYQGLRPYLDAHQINLIEYSVVGCRPMSVRGERPACAGTYEYILKKIERDKTDLVILSAHHLYWSTLSVPEVAAGYEKFVTQRMAELLNAGVQHILIVGQVPIWGGTLPRILNQEYLRRGQSAPTRMFTGLVPESIRIDGTMRSASMQFDVPYYSLKDQLCNGQGCLTRVGEELPDDLIVFDDGHLTTLGASYLLGSGLGQRIELLLAGEK
jgi:peptidoglycan/LPS O-acetylase OafA/YrhL